MKIVLAFQAIILTVYTFLSYHAFAFVSHAVFGKVLDFWLNLVIGFILGSVAIPGAFILWVCSLFGVQFPLVK